MADLQKLVDDLSTLTVLEAAELAKLLEDKWGVSAAAPMAMAAPAGGGAAAAPVEEKTEFDVILADAGANAGHADLKPASDFNVMADAVFSIDNCHRLSCEGFTEANAIKPNGNFKNFRGCATGLPGKFFQEGCQLV